MVRLDPLQALALMETLVMLFFPLSSEANPAAVRLAAGAEGGVALEVAVRTDRPHAPFGAGSALGLESARQIAEAHGGSLMQEIRCEQADRTAEVCVRVMLP
jgi:hypothetical protein